MLEEIINERKKKLERINLSGVSAYPIKTERTHAIGEALADFEKLSAGGDMVALAGRVVTLRDQGGVIFADLRDSGGEIQVILRKQDLPDFDFWQANLDRGDYISAKGKLMVTNRGTKSVAAEKVTMLSKSLRPLPTEHFGLEDAEVRLRKRYLDLIMDPELRKTFEKKNVFWQTFRRELTAAGFTEVELPVLEAIPGGAEAEPFTTHHNALDTEFYLRISLELPLKKLLVGGFDAVFEIGRIFRNEGIDREHLQDYTQMEFYWAYHNYHDAMDLVKDMYQKAIKNVTGGLKTVYAGQEVDWSGEWPMVDYVEIFEKENSLNPVRASVDELKQRAKELKIEMEANMGKGRLIDLIYKKTVRPKLVQPCFLIDPPVEIEPLAKRSDTKSGQVERFQVLAAGTELGKGFSELNDPIDQRARFEEQMKLREAGDKEAQMLDEDFLEALEYGMPPAAGFGVSERLFAVLMDKPVRETVFFPLMKQKND